MKIAAKELTRWKCTQASKRSVADFLASLEALVAAKESLLRNRDAAIADNNTSNRELRDDFRFILRASLGLRPLLLTNNREPVSCPRTSRPVQRA
jgi:hypothetical protein